MGRADGLEIITGPASHDLGWYVTETDTFEVRTVDMGVLTLVRSDNGEMVPRLVMVLTGYQNGEEVDLCLVIPTDLGSAMRDLIVRTVGTTST